MKSFLVLGVLVSALFLTQSAQAEIVLPAGSSITVGGQTVVCGGAAPQTSWLCVDSATFGGTFQGRGATKSEAASNAINACQRAMNRPDSHVLGCQSDMSYITNFACEQVTQ